MGGWRDFCNLTGHKARIVPYTDVILLVEREERREKERKREREERRERMSFTFK